MPPRDWNATSYERMSAPLEAMGREVLDRLDLRGDERVLDAGCGTGRVTAALLERLPRGEVVAVDGSPAMVEAARERLGDAAGNIAALKAAAELVGEREPFAAALAGWPGPWNFAGTQETAERLARRGWVDVWTWLQQVRVEPDDPHEYLGTVALGEHLERLNESLRAPFIDEVLEQLDEPVVEYTRLNILARRPS